MSKKYYAVKIGKVPGIYFNWDDCKAQVHGFKGAIYKSFDNISDAYALKLYENAEQRKIFCMNCLTQSSEELFFANKNGKTLKYTNANIALRNVRAKCTHYNIII